MYPLDYHVVKSNAELAVATNAQALRTDYFNTAMRFLFDRGCRRIVSPRPVRPRNGDGEKYILSGYAQ
jgi:hypothetical protein